MSTSVYDVTCTKCNFYQSVSRGVKFEFKGSPEKEPILKFGYCQNCDEIVRILKSYTNNEAAFDEKELKSKIEDYNSSFFAKLSSSRREKFNKAKKELELVNSRIEHFKKHKFHTQCLECSSDLVVEIELPYDQYNNRSFLNVKHRCGGELVISLEGRFNFLERAIVRYNESGKILLDQRKNKSNPKNKS